MMKSVPLPDSPRLMMALTGPLIGVVSGAVIGLFAHMARRIAALSIPSFQKKLAPGTVEIRISALRFLVKKVLKQCDLVFDDLVFPKTPKKLPVALSHEEVTQLIEAAPNLLYRTILMILYGTGLRRAEVVRLKVS
jgi:integrase